MCLTLHCFFRTILGFINLRQAQVSRHVQREAYTLPQSVFAGFSILFIVKSGWKGSLIELISHPKPTVNVTLFRIILTNNSLLVYNENDDYIKFNFPPGKRKWQQLALRVKNDTISLFNDCENIDTQPFSRNFSLWTKLSGKIVVGNLKNEDSGLKVSLQANYYKYWLLVISNSIYQ